MCHQLRHRNCAACVRTANDHPAIFAVQHRDGNAANGPAIRFKAMFFKAFFCLLSFAFFAFTTDSFDVVTLTSRACPCSRNGFFVFALPFCGGTPLLSYAFFEVPDVFERWSRAALLCHVEGNGTSDVLTSARPRHDHCRTTRNFS